MVALREVLEEELPVGARRRTRSGARSRSRGRRQGAKRPSSGASGFVERPAAPRAQVDEAETLPLADAPPGEAGRVRSNHGTSAMWGAARGARRASKVRRGTGTGSPPAKSAALAPSQTRVRGAGRRCRRRGHAPSCAAHQRCEALAADVATGGSRRALRIASPRPAQSQRRGRFAPASAREDRLRRCSTRPGASSTCRGRVRGIPSPPSVDPGRAGQG